MSYITVIDHLDFTQRKYWYLKCWTEFELWIYEDKGLPNGWTTGVILKTFVSVVESLKSGDWFSKHKTVSNKQVPGEELWQCIHLYCIWLKQLAFKLESSEHYFCAMCYS